MPPKLSIIIPCYNQGSYLEDALSSLEKADKGLYELIIVNDGSTDEKTNNYLRKLSESGYHVIFQENKGLSGARNAGIAVTAGEYILLLDADNRIRPEYLIKGIEALDKNPGIAVVYGNAQYFGEKEGVWKMGGFNLQRLMISNYIDACAIIRRSVLDKTGLYDTKMKWGWEDWDLWLRIAFAGYDFHYIDETLFDYRVTGTSMSRTLYGNYEKPNSIEDYVYEKYATRMGPQWIVGNFVKRFRKAPFLFLAKLILKAYFPEYYNKLLRKNKIRNGL